MQISGFSETSGFIIKSIPEVASGGFGRSRRATQEERRAPRRERKGQYSILNVSNSSVIIVISVIIVTSVIIVILG